MNSLASYKKHILLHQEDKKKLKCSACRQKFNFKSELKRDIMQFIWRGANTSAQVEVVANCLKCKQH